MKDLNKHKTNIINIRKRCIMRLLSIMNNKSNSNSNRNKLKKQRIKKWLNKFQKERKPKQEWSMQKDKDKKRKPDNSY